jgi:hypothetical protein
MTNDETKDIGEVLRGLEILPLPEGWTVVEGVCFVKCLGEDGFPPMGAATFPRHQRRRAVGRDDDANGTFAEADDVRMGTRCLNGDNPADSVTYRRTWAPPRGGTLPTGLDVARPDPLDS